MNIAQIVCAYPPYAGGIGNSAHKFYQILSEKYELKNFSPQLGKPWLIYGHAALWPQLIWQLKKYDLIFLHYPFFGTMGAVWLFKIFNRHKPLVIYYHMDVKNSSLLTKVLSLPGKLIRNRLLSRADTVLCSSLDYMEHSQAKKFYQKNKKKFIPLPFSVDTKKFKPDPLAKKNNQQLLFVGGLDQAHYFKGLNILIKTLAEIKDNHYQLTIIGEGKLRNDYEKLAQKLKIADQIKWLGKTNQETLITNYQNSDLLILPSINGNEAFGIVLIEAMATGLPVIATRLPGVQTVFPENKAGLLVHPNNCQELKTAITKIMADRHWRHQLGENARQLVLEKYADKIISQKLKEIFAKYENLPTK